METHKTVFVNTLSQYIKAITTTCLSLYTVRLVLSALGQSDYGIYSLVAGTIAMLGFIMLAGLIVNNGIVLIDYINPVPYKHLPSPRVRTRSRMPSSA